MTRQDAIEAGFDPIAEQAWEELEDPSPRGDWLAERTAWARAAKARRAQAIEDGDVPF